jgi:hypothetical protein
VPQGSVLSTHLFNYFVHNFLDAAALNLSYGDDFSLSESSNDLDLLGRKLSDSLKLVSEWANKNELIIAPKKSHVTLFTPWNREINKCPDVYYKGVLILVNVLCLNLDSLYNLSLHLNIAGGKGSSRLQLLKATSGQDFGDKETLKLTCDAFVKPMITYLTPIWYPCMNPNSIAIKFLRSIQNSGMRTIPGCHKMANRDHLLAETGMLPVSEYLSLLSCQFLANASQEYHPSH